MRLAILALAMTALMTATALPVEATGGNQSFRILTAGDAYMVGLSSSCPTTNTGLTCVVLRDNLGYDGLTGASTQIPDHVNHGFSCAATGSATSVVGNLLPFPANMAIADSFAVGFDLNADGAADTAYGGRVNRPPIGAVLNRVTSAANAQDVATLAGTPSWYLSNFALNGATPTVSGNVDGAGFIIWNQGGSDVTIACRF